MNGGLTFSAPRGGKEEGERSNASHPDSAHRNEKAGGQVGEEWGYGTGFITV